MGAKIGANATLVRAAVSHFQIKSDAERDDEPENSGCLAYLGRRPVSADPLDQIADVGVRELRFSHLS
jgi:hypothetical protein